MPGLQMQATANAEDVTAGGKDSQPAAVIQQGVRQLSSCLNEALAVVQHANEVTTSEHVDQRFRWRKPGLGHEPEGADDSLWHETGLIKLASSSSQTLSF